MEPFRAFVGDMLPSKQRTSGYVMQTVFIGIGAVVASAMPYIFAEWLGVANTAPEGQIPDAVRYSFYIGGVVLFVAVGWTILRTREYSPEQLASFAEPEVASQSVRLQAELEGQPVFSLTAAWLWSLAGVLASLVVLFGGWDVQLYILTAGILVYGLIQFFAISIEKSGKQSGFYDACRSVRLMPSTMRQLAVVQFFSWFALFAMWIYTTSAVTSHHYATTDPQSLAYNEGANWVGLMFASYNGFSILAALLIPLTVRAMGLKLAHQLNLMLGAVGLASIMLIDNPVFLIASMIGVGFAWASILSVPYAILSNAVPGTKMGIYMGVFNFFITIPQIVAASLLGLVLKYLFDGESIFMLGFAAACWVIAAASMFFVKYHD